jgi:hypothetical protein
VRSREGPAHHPRRQGILPTLEVSDLPAAAAAQKVKTRHRFRKTRQYFYVMVPRHSQDRDTRCSELFDTSSQVPICFVEVVLLLNDIAGKKHRVRAGMSGEGDGAFPGTRRPQGPCAGVLKKLRRQPGWLASEVNIADAEDFHRCLLD